MVPNASVIFPNVVQQLMDHESYEFFLTGSRFFNGTKVTPETDWDFFCEDIEGVTDFLVHLGFEQDVGNYGDDRSITCVYTYTYKTLDAGARRTKKIDVQLVNSNWYEIKHEAQMILAEIHPFGLPEAKDQARILWETIMKTVRKYKGDPFPTEQVVD